MRIDGWFDFAGLMFVVTTAAIAPAWLIGLGLKRRADLRHAVWLSALLVVPLAPALVWMGGALRLPPIARPKFAPTVGGPGSSANPGTRAKESPPSIADEPAPPSALQAEIKADVAKSKHDGSHMSMPSARPWPRTARALVVAVWLLGSLGLLARLIHGCRRVGRLRRDVRPLPIAVEAILPRVAAALGVAVDRLPTVGVSAGVARPLTLGPLRPLVLVPDGLAERLSADELRDVLIHECAHALRRDAVVGLLQRMTTVACWPNPLILVMNRALESAREELCDNHVLRASNPADYAASLLKVALLRPRRDDLDALLGLPFIARRGALEDRVKGLVDPRRNPSTAAPRALTICLAVLLFASSAAVAAIRFEDAEPAPAASKSRVEGVVVDAAGAPAAGAVVRLATIRDAFSSAIETRTDPDGRFGFDFDEVSNGVALGASSADGSLQSRVDFRFRENPNIFGSQFRLVLEPTREAVVRVTDARGEPVAGAAVVETECNLLSQPATRTNQRGEARLRIPMGAAPGQVIAFKSGVGFDYLEVGPASPERVELVLNGAITARVRVVDSANRPVAGAAVVPLWIKRKGRESVSTLGGYYAVHVATDQDGVANFDFLPSDAPQYVSFVILAEPYHLDQHAHFDSTHPVDVLTARVSRGASVTGRVLTADEKPAPGILIQADGQAPDFEEAQALARTAADGSYRLDLPPNRTYSIGVVDDHRAALTRNGVVPREGRSLKHIDFHLEEGTIVRGRVTNKATGEPVADHHVDLFEWGNGIVPELHDRMMTWNKLATGLRRCTRTDRDGRYSFRVAQGSYFHPDGIAPWTEPFEVIDQPEIVFDFTFQPEPKTAAATDQK